MKGLKIIFVIFIFFLVSTGFFALKVFSAGKNVFEITSGDTTNFLKQLSPLNLAQNNPLRGEKEGRINILLLGKGGEGHQGENLTDTIIVLSIKTNLAYLPEVEVEKASFISIPRDLWIQPFDSDYWCRINAVKTYGENLNGKNQGIKVLEKTIEEISGLPIHYYLILDFQGFINIVDALGGIDLEIEEEIFDPLFPTPGRGYETFSLEKGKHHFDGQLALKYVRTRHSLRGDFDRARRQQKMLEAIKEESFSGGIISDLKFLNKLLQTLSEHLRTNIQPTEISRFIEISSQISPTKTINKVIDSNPIDGLLRGARINGASVLLLRNEDFSEIQELFQNIFSKEVLAEKEKEIILIESANIEIQNGTGFPDLANSTAKALEKFGYIVIKTSNISLPEAHGNFIYNFTGDKKSQTLEFLKEKFKAEAIIDSKNKIKSKADFVIILGEVI
jgi:LCP family protein required for cell wall assembly